MRWFPVSDTGAGTECYRSVQSEPVLDVGTESSTSRPKIDGLEVVSSTILPPSQTTMTEENRLNTSSGFYPILEPEVRSLKFWTGLGTNNVFKHSTPRRSSAAVIFIDQGILFFI